MPKYRLKQAVKESFRHHTSHNRSNDLVKLAREFEVFKVKIRRLVEALAAEHKCLIMLNKSRMNVAVQLTMLSDKTPLEQCAGTAPPPGDDSPPSSSDMGSYMDVHHNMHHRIDMYAGRFATYILNYAVEWEKVVVTRITTNLKQSEKLRRELDHYQAKVESMRLSTNKIMAQGKMVKPETAEKLKRNEEKLFQARRSYEEFATDLCLLIEEVTERSWKDLHPIFIKLAQFDGSLAADEHKFFSNLLNVAEDLKQVARTHGLKPQARLKAIETEKGQSISTKQPQSLTMIEADKENNTNLTDDQQSNSSSSISFESCNPTDNLALTAATATPNVHSSTTHMLEVAAKAPPPPTFEMVEAATRDMSLEDNDSYSANSVHSPIVPSAPPPASAPPPPPPQPKLSMFSNIQLEDQIPEYNTHPTMKPTTNPFHPSYTSSSSPVSITNSAAGPPKKLGYNPFGSDTNAPQNISTNPFDN